MKIGSRSMLYEELEDVYVQTSLGRLHFKLRNGSPTVVFLHGFGASMRSYAKLVGLLPDGLGVCLVDLLGHGDSDAPRIEYTIGRQVQAVKELLQAKQLQDSYIFGHSYGAWIAASIAQGNYKGRGTVLEDAMGLKEIFDDIERTGRAEEWKERWIAEALVFNPRDYVIRSAVNAQPSDEYLTRESLSAIVKPALIIWGSDDKTLDVKYARTFNDYIKGSALEIVQGAGHTAHYTYAEEVKDLLLKFVGYGT
ncbi:MAG: alpha/beta fold hydrolase [Candidatus Micrarchaeota archaeon]|nr:alpha/beta fold hydrolase [Candidatus Micrarchaeota archaeon]